MKEKITFKQLVREWQKEELLDDYGAKIHLPVNRIFKYSDPIFKNRDIHNIKSEHIVKVIDSIYDDKNEKDLNKLRLSQIIKFSFAYAKNKNYIMKSPYTKEVHLYRREKRLALSDYKFEIKWNKLEKVIKILSENELEILKPYINDSKYAKAYLLALNEGVTLPKLGVYLRNDIERIKDISGVNNFDIYALRHHHIIHNYLNKYDIPEASKRLGLGK